jgi:hypothetical protein
MVVVLFPDALPLESLISLNKLRRELESGRIDLEAARENLIATSDERAVAVARSACNPLTACLVIGVARGDLGAYVGDPVAGCCYQIDPAAVRDGCPGFLAMETMAAGKLAVVRSLMPHGSLEAISDGRPILVRKSEVLSLLKVRHPLRSTVRRAVREVMADEVALGYKLKKESFVACAKRRPGMLGARTDRIWKAAIELDPERSKPGPKQRSAVTTEDDADT